ncbi:MAG TPA: ATP-binding protein [Anaerolineaceae bacterium]|nr:ATP-binding protein [Anaerolineaceae bacterium]
MRELSLHLLDIAENSVAARATTIFVVVEENLVDDQFSMAVIDNGCGMSAEMVEKVLDPFVTSRTTRKVGLGLPLLKAAAEACNGSLTIQSTLNQGTKVEVNFQRSHIDRMPLGDLGSTFISLLIGAPEVHWLFRYCVNDQLYELDSQPILETLDGVPLTDPAVLAYLREEIDGGVRAIRPADSF